MTSSREERDEWCRISSEREKEIFLFFSCLMNLKNLTFWSFLAFWRPNQMFFSTKILIIFFFPHFSIRSVCRFRSLPLSSESKTNDIRAYSRSFLLLLSHRSMHTYVLKIWDRSTTRACETIMMMSQRVCLILKERKRKKKMGIFSFLLYTFSLSRAFALDSFFPVWCIVSNDNHSRRGYIEKRNNDDWW